MDNVGAAPGGSKQMTDEQTGDELREVVAALGALQGQMTEWSELHRLLHGVLLALSLFQAHLTPFCKGDLSTNERQMLLQDWRLCQGKLDALADFAEGIERIGRPFQREGRELCGERWAVEIVALQLLFEDTLTEEDFSLAGLFDLAEEFAAVCHRHLALANHKLLTAVGESRRLSMRLLGEI